MRLDNNMFTRVLRAADDAGGGGGGGGADKGGGGGGGDKGGGADKGGQPFYAGYGLEKDDVTWLEGHKFGESGPKAFVQSARHFEKIARDRNVLEMPDPKNLKGWKGLEILGWKEKPEEYKLEVVKPARGGDPDVEMLDVVRKSAHANFVPVPAAQAIYKDLTGFIDKRLGDLETKGTAELEKLNETLRGKWGTDYDHHTEIARRTARTAGLNAVTSSELEKIVGSPRLLEWLYNVGAKLGEANLITADGGGGGAKSPSALDAELTKFEQDPENIKIMNDQRNPRHKEVIAARQNLINQLAEAQARNSRAA